MDFGQRFLANGSFRERQKKNFVHRSSRALGAGIEFTDGFHLVAKQLNAQRTIGLGWIRVQQAATHRVLAGHFNHINAGITDGVQVLDKFIHVQQVSASHNPRQSGIMFCRAQAHGRGFQRSNHNRDPARNNLPQSSRALLLNFRMRRHVLKRQHVVCGQLDHRIWAACAGQLAKGLHHWEQRFRSTVVADNHDQRR